MERSSQGDLNSRDFHPSSILIIKPSSLGDIVHTLPAAMMIRRRWPEARLGWLSNPEWAPILEGTGLVDEVIDFPRNQFRGVRGWLKIPRWVSEMSGRRADLVVDFQGLLRSALVGRIASGGELVGLEGSREGARFFYDRTVPLLGRVHAVDRSLRLVEGLGIALGGPLTWRLPEGSAPEGFDGESPYVLLHPFSRGVGKSLTRNEVEAFCRGMAPRRVVLVGRLPGEFSGVESWGKVENLLNRTTLLELIWLIRRAQWVVSVDSGPMHMAAALTANLLSIHTWSDPRLVGPYQAEAWVWKGGELFQMKDVEKVGGRAGCAGVREVAAFVGRRVEELGE